MAYIRRREFITLLGGAAAAWPLAARAQQPGRVRRIGILNQFAEDDPDGARLIAAFQQRLQDLGWTAGRNIRVDQRFGANDVARLRASAAELVALAPDVLLASNTNTLQALVQRTHTIPIVFYQVSDPLADGFVASLARPGGNVTGFASGEFALYTKTVEFLKKIAPKIERVTTLYDPAQPAATGGLPEIEVAAAALGMQFLGTAVRNEADIERAIDALAREPNGGLFVFPGPSTALHLERIAALATRHRLPSAYPFRFFAEGGLVSYGVDDNDLCRRAASYADRILKGEKPADLPVQLPTKFNLVLNLKTAKTIGLDLSPEVLALADEVIE